jgi:hypothetical protein
VYGELEVYPEDTVQDLRLKLRCVAGVPPYRQHLFFYVNEEGPAVPYRFTLDGVPVPVDWRALARAPSGEALVAGMEVDPRLEERREGIRVEALDTFTRLGPVPGVRLTRAYYVDLYGVLPPLGAPERPNDGLAGVLRDSFQFDLLYYGGLLRYWPQLSADACKLALGEPGQVAGAYPALDPDPEELWARFGAERVVAGRALAWRPAAAKGGRSATAVTTATVRVAPESVRARVSVRNVFDWIPTGGAVAAATARFDVDASLLTEAGAAAVGPEARAGGLVSVAGVKRHASSYGPRSAAVVGWFAARPARRDSVAFAIAREDPSEGGGAVPYAFLTVFGDGRYEATADWREDDRVGFEAVAAEVAAVVAPTVEAINAMGAAAFPVGGELAAGRPQGGSAALGAITVSAFWPHALTAATFREVKQRFRVYEQAGIVGIRGLQQAGAYTFVFRKGVVAYDPRLADRAEAGARASRAEGPGATRTPANQYAWLTDPGAAARWASSFAGRTVRIYHRATDLRVEIVGADSLAEFELIRRYLFSFLDGLLVGPGRLPVGAARADGPPRAEAGPPPPVSRRLRRLQERDPALFDLKRYDQAATVYSVLCQSGRQPAVYSAAEAEQLGARRRGALVRYWNFTEGEPAFYECPGPKYPHLSFRAGQHPLGYCLPCCKKTRPASGSRAALVNTGCLERAARRGGPGAGPPGEAPAGEAPTGEAPLLSRHVLTYGKEVPPGRLSEPPREVAEGLFLDAVPPPYRLLLVGVEQAAPAVPDAGFAYALAYAVGAGEESTDEVLTTLAGLAAAMGDTYYALGGGGAAAFASAGDLADAILGAFVRRDPALSPLGPGGAAAEAWPDILAELARHAYGVETVVLSDPDGTGRVSVEAAPGAVAALVGAGACGDPRGREPPRVALVAQGPMGTYPVAALDPKLYLRANPAQRWMLARRTFGRDDRGAAAGVVGDQVAAYVREALAARLAGPGGAGRPLQAPARAVADLALLARYACRPGATFRIDARLVDMHDRCYGVLLRGAAGQAYVPVRYSAYPVDGTPVVFGPRPEAPLPVAALVAAVEDINRYVREAGEPYAPIEAEAKLVDNTGQVVGFVTAAPPPLHLHFFHDPAAEAQCGPWGGARAARLPYDAREVAAAIAEGLGRSRAPAGPDPVTRKAWAANSRNRLYRLFLAEFSAVLRADRNPEMRRSLAAALGATRFESARSVAGLRRRLAELLGDRPSDLQAMRDAVARAYAEAPWDPGAAAAAAVEATPFGFDQQILARLQALESRGAVVAALRELLEPRVERLPAGTLPEAAAQTNIFVSCAEATAVPKAQCAGRRLAVPADRLDDFYDILAADVQNPGKTALLAAVSAGVSDPLAFQRRPGEHLTVTFGAAPGR